MIDTYMIGKETNKPPRAALRKGKGEIQTRITAFLPMGERDA